MLPIRLPNVTPFLRFFSGLAPKGARAGNVPSVRTSNDPPDKLPFYFYFPLNVVRNFSLVHLSRQGAVFSTWLVKGLARFNGVAFNVTIMFSPVCRAR